MASHVTLIGIDGIPEITVGNDLGLLLVDACARQGTPLVNGDVLVVTQKIISKAEGQVVDLRKITPSALAIDFAMRWDKDARAVEVVLQEAVRIVRMENGVMITETRHGFICANSGVDASNVGTGDIDYVVLLPKNSDASARLIRDRVRELTKCEIAVIVSDTFGRAWREGAADVAIGVAGIEPLWDYRGKIDNDGRELRSTVIAVADEIAAATELVTNKLTNVPAAIVRGYPYLAGETGIAPMIRDREKDLFR